MPARHDYRIGWICALPLELAAAQAILDEIHTQLPNAPADRNNYILGSIGAHNVVVACLPAGVYGTTSATATAIQMRFSYESIQCCLLVGIGGGVGIAGAKSDIRLGDVVVSEPTMHYGGVIQYDHGKAVHGGHFVPTGTLDKPPEVILKALARLKAQHMVHGSTAHLIHQHVLSRSSRLREQFSCPGPEKDRLFVSDYIHEDSSISTCDQCDPEMLQHRRHRPDSNTKVFYGLIASANQVIKDSVLRDQLSQRYGILCFEMEAAGMMNVFPSLVIRGVCDYSDSHKNEQWQGYAAMAAAAYAKELILFMPLFDVTSSEQAEMVPIKSSPEGDISNKKQHLAPTSFLDTPRVPIYTPKSGPVKELKSKTSESSTKSNDTFSNPPFAINLYQANHYPPNWYPAESNSRENPKGNNNISSNNNNKSQEDVTSHISENFSRIDLRIENIPEKIIPKTDPQKILDIRISMAYKEGLWHPWPGDCVDLFYALLEWFGTVSRPCVVVPTSANRTRVKDLAVEVIRFLIQWKERFGSNYQVLWALGLSHPDRPKNESLKSLIFSISKAYPEEFRQTLSQPEMRSEFEDEEEMLWLLLRLLMCHITNAFVIVDPEDYHFLSRISSLANECYNNTATSGKVKFFIVFNGETNEIQYHRIIKVPPPRARMRSLPREGLSWNWFVPGF